MSEAAGTAPAARPDRGRRVRGTAVAVVSLIALDAAVISYSHALTVIRAWVGGARLAYLVPLLPDGLILLSSVAIYEAARAGVPRPRWAYAGLGLGCFVTVALNVAAGWHHGWGGRLVDALAPVVLLLALEILAGILRRGRGSDVPRPAAAAPGQLPPLSLDEAVRAAAPHMSQRELAAAFGIGKTTAARKIKAAPAAMNGASHE
jgi:hypothetical protein